MYKWLSSCCRGLEGSPSLSQAPAEGKSALPRTPYVPIKCFAQCWMHGVAFCLCFLGLVINTSSSHALGDIARRKITRTLPSAKQQLVSSSASPGSCIASLCPVPPVPPGLASSAWAVFLLIKVSPRKQELMWSEMLSSTWPTLWVAEESLSKG